MTRTVDSIPLPLIEVSPSPLSREFEQTLLHFIEPAFRITYQGDLRIDARGWESKAKTFFAHAVARTPKTLLLHVQRIYLLWDMADPDIHGALIDLFLVLDGKGNALCNRLLSMASPLLQRNVYQQLREHLKHGGNSKDLSACGSMFSSAQQGHEILIQQEKFAQEKQTDPLLIASEQLAYGQTDLARKTLEGALLADPQRLELHHALLEIYRHSRARSQLANFLHNLDDISNPAPTAWQELINELDKDHD